MSTIVVASVIAAIFVWPAVPASATTITLSGTVGSTGWTFYTTVRATQQNFVAFTPDDLLDRPSGADTGILSLKLRNGAGTADLSGPQTWTELDMASKTLVSGLATGTQFRMAACCYQNWHNDFFWSGTLTY